MRSCAEAVLRRTGAVLALLLGTLALPGPVLAQVAQGATTLVVPTPPGGPIDRVARIVAQGLSSVLGEPVVVENKGGAAGKIGVQAALRAARDGHTLIAVSPSIASVNPVVDKAAGYDPLKDFDPLGIVAFNDGVLAVRADLPVTDMPGLVAYAKAHPGALTYGSFGVGTSLHLQTEELLYTLGITARHVPCKGEAQAMNALIAGEVDMMAYVASPIVPFVANGRARALAATASTRWLRCPRCRACGDRHRRAAQLHLPLVGRHRAAGRRAGRLRGSVPLRRCARCWPGPRRSRHSRRRASRRSRPTPRRCAAPSPPNSSATAG